MNFSTIYYWSGVFETLSRNWSIVCAFVFIIVVAPIPLSEGKILHKWWYYPIVLFAFLFMMLGIFIPDRNTIIVMYAGDQVQEIIHSDKVQKLGGKAYDVINKAMDQYLHEKNK